MRVFDIMTTESLTWPEMMAIVLGPRTVQHVGNSKQHTSEALVKRLGEYLTSMDSSLSIDGVSLVTVTLIVVLNNREANRASRLAALAALKYSPFKFNKHSTLGVLIRQSIDCAEQEGLVTALDVT